MCFNAAKSWQLGWYTDRHAEFQPELGHTQVYTMVGVSEYSNSSDSYAVIVKLSSSSNIGYYIGYNRRSGINSDTGEASNQVALTLWKP